MLDDGVIGRRLELVVGAEAEVVVFQLGGRVYPAPVVAAERALLVVVGDDVLTELRADRLEPVPEVADDGEIAQDRVLPLRQVVPRHGHGHHEEDP